MFKDKLLRFGKRGTRFGSAKEDCLRQHNNSFPHLTPHTKCAKKHSHAIIRGEGSERAKMVSLGVERVTEGARKRFFG